ncbi:radical SAM domain-containing protein [[Clostridium] sordellii]|uniref:radical SAM/SPASM domain-containing protein n=1 Tax=Paraclostridium sordellii TaxID=1505 RepID=UPI0005E60BF7|nr:radical SAM protein [Paeniclostridium sordellii]CEN23299.1 radical SAM domain-containing protein [[Clostridium] sordellii] [Paeniclostridium sordellii]
MTTAFWITSNCNLRCKYCYEGLNKLNLSMTKEIIDKGIEFMVENSNYSEEETIMIPIHGGEPFLEFDNLKYLVNGCKKAFYGRNISFVTTTNMTILNDEILKFIIAEIPDITLSIDGSSETHNKMRIFSDGSGSHDIAIKNGMKLLKHLPNIRIRTTFDSSTVINLFEDVKFLINKGFKFIVPGPNLFDPNWNNDNMKELEKEIIKIREYLKDNKGVFVSIVDKETYKQKGICNGGKTSFQVYPNGKIYPCTLVAGMEEFEIGDIYNGIDIKKRDEILFYSKDIVPSCDGCKLYNYCDGPMCKIINKLITNDYNMPSAIHCAIENVRYKVNFK